MTARRKRPASVQDRLEARTVTVHVSVGHGASVEAEGVPLADVGPLIAYAVELRRALIERGYDELIPSDVTTVPAARGRGAGRDRGRRGARPSVRRGAAAGGVRAAVARVGYSNVWRV